MKNSIVSEHKIKGFILAGFSGIGKTMLAQKYSNVVDLDPFVYAYSDNLNGESIEKHKGETHIPNPDWPQNYLDEIKRCTKIYDLVLVWDRIDIVKEYIANNFSFAICYPDDNSLKKFYKDRFLSRGNSEKYVEWKLKQYEEKIAFFDTLDVPKYILKENETLEDFLKKNSFSLQTKSTLS